ncbi:MAG: NAD(P)/FAD-dependent oxidoreductase [Nitrospirota bacterium]
MDETTITIIGAGVVGLAVAAELSHHCDSIIVVDRQDSFGRETSSRNSEVIHSGIYYPEGSLKASLCVQGASQLYQVCEQHSIPFKKTGKLIVATDTAEIPILEQLLQKGSKNSVNNLVLLDKKETLKKERNVLAEAALYSPDTGIVDSHALMKFFYNKANAQGVLFAFDSELDTIRKEADGYLVGIKQDGYQWKSKIIINCAGLDSDLVAQMAGIDIHKSGYELTYCKGSYFSYSKSSPVSMLIYPVPHEELVGLGVHATLDLGSRLRFGPDTEYIDRVLDYKVIENKKDAFYQGACKMISGLDREAFVPDMAGIRPKLQKKGEKTKDFIIRHEADKGLDGFINLVGIESPGLTSSVAIGKMVSKMVQEMI